MPKRKKVELPSVPELKLDEKGAETTEQISRRLGVPKQHVLELIHRYADLGQLRYARIDGVNIVGIACKHTVYWLEIK